MYLMYPCNPFCNCYIMLTTKFLLDYSRYILVFFSFNGTKKFSEHFNTSQKNRCSHNRTQKETTQDFHLRFELLYLRFETVF